MHCRLSAETQVTRSVQGDAATQSAVHQVRTCLPLQSGRFSSGPGFLTLSISAAPGGFLTTSGVVGRWQQFGHNVGSWWS